MGQRCHWRRSGHVLCRLHGLPGACAPENPSIKLLPQMPGGRMAEVYGGKRVLAVAMGGVSVLTLLIPVTAKAAGKEGYPYLLIIVRLS